MRGKTIGAHRYSYEFYNNCKIPADLLIRHSCDNPPCVNPYHLLPGTHQDNSDDARHRGRTQLGFSKTRKHGPEVIAQVKKQREDGETLRSIARKMGLHHSTVDMLLKRS